MAWARCDLAPNAFATGEDIQFTVFGGGVQRGIAFSTPGRGLVGVCSGTVRDPSRANPY